MFDGFDDRPPERHRGFTDAKGLLAHVALKAPKSCFYSTAYYEDPNQRKMLDKIWRGADLIFDLDGDHLPGVSGADFPTMLAKIQQQAWSLWNDFLAPEFGFDEKHLQVTFSGHRGFHLHYRAPDIWHLDSSARRELVSHIRGEGIDVQAVLKGADCAWRRRLLRGVESVLSRLDRAALDDADGRAALTELKAIIDARSSALDSEVARIGKETLRQVAEKAQNAARRENLQSGLSQGILKPVFGGPRSGKEHDRVFRELVRGDGAVVLGNAGETDENVTIDVKRVIRWPTSLHGKSGMLVTEFPLSRLDPSSSNPFQPLIESVPWDMNGHNHRVKATIDDCVAKIGNQTVELALGEEVDVSEGLATFLILKNWAESVEISN
jgi:DNA primase small subunit